MTDLTPFNLYLTPDRAKAVLEAAGARNVTIKARTTGKMWAFFSHHGQAQVWGLRIRSLERNFIRDVERELPRVH